MYLFEDSGSRPLFSFGINEAAIVIVVMVRGRSDSWMTLSSNCRVSSRVWNDSVLGGPYHLACSSGVIRPRDFSLFFCKSDIHRAPLIGRLSHPESRPTYVRMHLEVHLLLFW